MFSYSVLLTLQGLHALAYIRPNAEDWLDQFEHFVLVLGKQNYLISSKKYYYKKSQKG